MGSVPACSDWNRTTVASRAERGCILNLRCGQVSGLYWIDIRSPDWRRPPPGSACGARIRLPTKLNCGSKLIHPADVLARANVCAELCRAGWFMYSYGCSERLGEWF